MPSSTAVHVESYVIEPFRDGLRIQLVDKFNRVFDVKVVGDVARPNDEGEYGDYVENMAVEFVEELAAHLGMYLRE